MTFKGLARKIGYGAAVVVKFRELEKEDKEFIEKEEKKKSRSGKRGFFDSLSTNRILEIYRASQPDTLVRKRMLKLMKDKPLSISRWVMIIRADYCEDDLAEIALKAIKAEEATDFEDLSTFLLFLGCNTPEAMAVMEKMAKKKANLRQWTNVWRKTATYSKSADFALKQARLTDTNLVELTSLLKDFRYHREGGEVRSMLLDKLAKLAMTMEECHNMWNSFPDPDVRKVLTRKMTKLDV